MKVPVSFPMTGAVDQAAPCGAVQRYVDWVAGVALPLWAQPRPGAVLPFAECRDLRGGAPAMGYVRLRVMARQLSVYTQAAAFGVPGAEAVAAQGWQALMGHYWSDRAGWAKRVDDDGRACDRGFDLYDQSFAIYACAHWVRVSGAAQPLDLAGRTLGMIDARLRVPGQPGWRSDEADVGFDQNSHMHFLEALLTLDALPSGTGVAGDVRARIVEILRLLADRLVAPGTAAIREWFDDRWAVPEGRDVVEPGHLYEWAWLLAQAGRQGFAPRIEGARLHAFADTHGWHPHRRLIVDSCREDGEWISPDHRLWPHCEAIRAATVLADADAGHRMAQHIAARMMDVFLDRPFAGGWIDRVDADLQPAASAVPATSLYHLWEAGLALVRAGWAQLPHQVASC